MICIRSFDFPFQYSGRYNESHEEECMIVRKHEDLQTHELPGIRHKTVAGPGEGLEAMEVWRQVLAPGAGTPWHRAPHPKQPNAVRCKSPPVQGWLEVSSKFHSSRLALSAAEKATSHYTSRAVCGACGRSNGMNLSIG